MAGALSLHFSFLDRSLGYDCAACGSLCCKGAGLSLDGTRTLGEAAAAALGAAPPALRALAFASLGHRDAELESA